jgi:hypothetical protein
MYFFVRTMTAFSKLNGIVRVVTGYERKMWRAKSGAALMQVKACRLSAARVEFFRRQLRDEIGDLDERGVEIGELTRGHRA